LSAFLVGVSLAGRFLAAFFHFAPDLAEAARAADQTGAALSGDKFSKFSLEVRVDQNNNPHNPQWAVASAGNHQPTRS
jgi:hypothetical protein